MKSSLTEVIKTMLRPVLRWYGMRVPLDKGKYRLVNVLAPRLVPARDPIVAVQAPDGFRMSLDLREHIQQRAYYLGYYEHIIARLLVRYTAKSTTVFDVGANFGQFTLLAAHTVGSSGQVLAFEPSPLAFAALVRNVKLNGFDHVICRQTAVSIAPGTASFYATPPDDLGTGSLARAAAEQFHQNISPLMVEVERLDDYLDRLTRPVSVIKMDIEGAELLALQGAERLIRHYHPTLILEADANLTRVFGYTPGDLGAYLRDLGYAVYSVPTRPWQQPVPLQWPDTPSHDILCLHEPRTSADGR